MRLENLRNFTVVVEEGNVSRAARRVHVAQPALSAQIRNLEVEFGAALFERTSRGMTLTPAGEILLHHVRIVLDNLDLARQAIRERSTEIGGDVTFALPAKVSAVLSPRLLRVVSERYPLVKLRLHEAYSLECSEMVCNARVDLGILSRPLSRSSHEIALLFEQGIYLVGAPENRYGYEIGEGDIPFREAAAYPLVLPARPNSLRMQLDGVAQEVGVALNVEREENLDLNHIVAGGTAFSLRPWVQIRDQIASGAVKARRVVDPPVLRQYYLCRPRSKAPTPAAEAIAREIRSIWKDVLASGARGGFLD
jgi:LysR family nitrogen assimilation transcriptional regulator